MRLVRAATVLAVAFSVGAAGSAAGCARSTSGTARPNDAAAAQAVTEAYERGIEAFERHFERLRDEKSRAYYYVRYAGKTLDREVDVYFQGAPPAVLSRISGPVDGDEFDKFHPAGSDLDYVRLGPKLAHLAPTPWVSEGTVYGADLFSPCLLDGVSSACGLSRALAQTRLAAPEGLVKEARRNPDGTIDVLTGITLETFVEFKVMIFGDELKSTITEEMNRTVLPVRITLNPEGKFGEFELRASVPGEPTPLQLQLGYQALGRAERSDFPQPPAAGEVTAITDQAASDKFWDDIYAIQGR